MNDRMALVFANIDNSTMDLFTSARSLGALPFGCRYRLIDFSLSNLVNSGVEIIGVPVREKYQSLLDHIGIAREWDLDRRTGGFTFLPPFAFINQSSPYDTKLKALIGSESYLVKNHAEYVFLCEPDVVTNLDLDALLRRHIEAGNDVTYLTVPQGSKDARGTYDTAFKADETGHVLAISAASGDPAFERLSTGICVMSRSLLLDLISFARVSSYEFFETELLSRYVSTLKIGVVDHTGYITKVRTLYDYFNASMDMLDTSIRRDVFFRNGHIYTKTHSDVPVLYGLDSVVRESLIADGSSIEGHVEHSLIFRRVKLGKKADIASSIIMQDSVIGDGAVLRYCITDKNVHVAPGAHIIGDPTHPRLLTKGQTYVE